MLAFKIPTNYCQVCRHYCSKNNMCRRGHKVFCSDADFIPSAAQTVVNFFDAFEDKLPNVDLDEYLFQYDIVSNEYSVEGE